LFRSSAPVYGGGELPANSLSIVADELREYLYGYSLDRFDDIAVDEAFPQVYDN
jgi:hypothetical protein